MSTLEYACLHPCWAIAINTYKTEIKLIDCSDCHVHGYMQSAGLQASSVLAYKLATDVNRIYNICELGSDKLQP